MITLAACRTTFVEHERNIVEDWASPRGHEGCSPSLRTFEWENSHRGYAWLKATFAARCVYDERSITAVAEQVRWLQRRDPTWIEQGALGEHGMVDLGDWTRAPLGQRVRGQRGRR